MEKPAEWRALVSALRFAQFVGWAFLLESAITHVTRGFVVLLVLGPACPASEEQPAATEVAPAEKASTEAEPAKEAPVVPAPEAPVVPAAEAPVEPAADPEPEPPMAPKEPRPAAADGDVDDARYGDPDEDDARYGDPDEDDPNLPVRPPLSPRVP